MIRKGGHRFSEKIMLKKIRQSGMAIRRKAIPLCGPSRKMAMARWNFDPVDGGEPAQELML
jgi:hypothetical protein